MKKYIALIISVIFILMTAIPASAATPQVCSELALINFRNFYEYQTGGKTVKRAFNAYFVSPGNGKFYILIKFISEDAEEKEYYHTFGENNMYYEKSDVTNLLYPSGLVVCEEDNMYTGYKFEYDGINPPIHTYRDASEWTDDDFMSVEKACSLDPDLAEALVKKSENIGIVPVEERPTESSAETTPTESSSVTEPTTESEEVTDATEPSDTMPAPTEPTGTEPAESTAPTENITATEPAEKTPTTAKTTVTVKNAPKTLYVKGTAKIKATVKNGKGATTYKSSKTKVAKVSASGKITALKKGTATITVTNNGVSKSFKITVKNPKLNKSKKTFKKGSTFKLKITGKVGKAKFTSNNNKVATVNKNGKITAKKKGKATITVKTNGINLKCKITVK